MIEVLKNISTKLFLIAILFFSMTAHAEREIPSLKDGERCFCYKSWYTYTVYVTKIKQPKSYKI